MSASLFRRVDIHAHLQFPEFEPDRGEVIRRAFDSGTAVMNVGTDLASSRAAVSLADQYPEGLYAVIGLHPTHATEEEFDADAFRELAAHPGVVGIGECGLDYFRRADSAEPGGATGGQKELFSAQIVLANEFGKPLMLHIRTGEGKSVDAYDDALEILRAEAKVIGNAHFFAGTTEQAKKFLDLGYTLSFTGVITFARQYEELVEFVPLDMIQAETDCPFVAPMPHRGQRNEPAYVAEVIAKIARIKKLPLEEVEQALLANACRVWGLKI